jgi:peroxiredoxin
MTMLGSFQTWSSLSVLLTAWTYSGCAGAGQQTETAATANTVANAVERTEASAEALPTSSLETSFVRPDGSRLELVDLRGKKAVVLLFTRGFRGEFACYFCGQQTRDYKDSYARFVAAGAEVLLVLPGATDAQGFLRTVGEGDALPAESEFTVPYPVVLDPDYSACHTFEVPVGDPASETPFPIEQPATIVIGRDGKLLAAFHGKDPSDRPSAEDVLAVLGAGPAREVKSESPVVPGAHPTLAWSSFEEGLALARSSQRPILLEFYADW